MLDKTATKPHKKSLLAQINFSRYHYVSKYKFVLNGRRANMFKQDHIRVYREMIEKTVILGGADLCLCQQIGNHCVVHYTGEIENLDNLKAELNHVPRLRFKKVDEIKVDNNLKKIIRNQTFE